MEFAKLKVKFNDLENRKTKPNYQSKSRLWECRTTQNQNNVFANHFSQLEWSCENNLNRMNYK